MDIAKSLRCHSGGTVNVFIKEIEMTNQGLFYLAHTRNDCSQLQSWPFRQDINLHGNNIAGFASKNVINQSVY